MSDNQAKAIKFMAVLGGLVGAAVCVAMAFAGTETVTAMVLWLLLAAVCLVLIYPLYQIGNLTEALGSHEEKLKILANRQSKIAKSASDMVSKYSPMSKNIARSGKTPTGASASIPNAAERTIHYEAVSHDDVTVGKTKQPTGDLTREFSQPEKKLNAETGEVGVENAARDHSDRPKGTIMSVGTETFEINRKYKAVTRFVPLVSLQTISAGGLHTVAVRRNGYVAATGYGTYGQCDVSSWRDIISVSAGNHHTVGLRSDGTCVACGYSGYGQCDVSGWNSICAIAAGTSHTVGLLENGTCVAVGDNTYGQCNVFDWTDIISITANSNYTVGLRVDGTIVAVGANTDGQWGAIKWGGITAVAAGGLHTIGLRSDGTCVSVGNNANNQCEVSRWNHITAIAAGNFHTVGLKEDGRVVAVGHNGYGQCNVSEWTDIIAISAGRNHTIALDRTGRVFAAGDNTYGQCSVMDFTDIKTSGI